MHTFERKTDVNDNKMNDRKPFTENQAILDKQQANKRI